MFKFINKKTKKRITKKIDKTLKLNEKRVSRFLIVLAIVFLGAFLIIISFYNNFFRNFKIGSGFGNKKSAFEQKMDQMVQGYPIESMVPQIAQKDRRVAAFMISIAKKESNWGKRVPVLNGKDCYNYWGYRGQSDEMGTGGHTCFKSREEAVDVVSKRLSELINDDNLDSPQKLVVWKCGDACSSDNPMNVRKWIKDVGYYYQKILD